MLKRLLKFVLKNDIGIRVRGGWRLQSALCHAYRSVPIRISGYPPLYIDMLAANCQGLELLRDEPFTDIPHEKQIQSLARRLIRPGDVVLSAIIRKRSLLNFSRGRVATSSAPQAPVIRPDHPRIAYCGGSSRSHDNGSILRGFSPAQVL